MPVERAYISDISRCSFHDGPGIRSVVYFKGCNLACLWCHNPETQRAGPEIIYHVPRCIGCGRCVEICPNGCHRMEQGRHVFSRAKCTGCGLCCEACPNDALILCGTSYEPKELLELLLRDEVYYRHSGGGVTFSGGECMLYPGYLLEILGMCKENHLHTAVETALNVPWDAVEKIRRHVDLFFIDVKLMDSPEHLRNTGVRNEKVLDNISRLAQQHDYIFIRVPLIPGVNDSDGNLIATGKFANSLGGGVRHMELLKYNPLGASKYRDLGRQAQSFGASPQSDKEMQSKCDRINAAVGRVGFASYTGASTASTSSPPPEAFLP